MVSVEKMDKEELKEIISQRFPNLAAIIQKIIRLGQGGGGGKQTSFLGQIASPSSDENRHFPDFNPWNKDFQTKFRKTTMTRFFF